MSTIAETVLKCIAEQLCVQQSEIKPETTFNELRADSLDMVELEMYIEDEFEIECDDPWAPDNTDITVEAYIAAVEKRLESLPGMREKIAQRLESAA